MRRFSVAGGLSLFLCACGAPDSGRAVVTATLTPEAPMTVARGQQLTRTVHVGARQLSDGSEVTGVLVTPQCHWVAHGGVDGAALLANVTCSFSPASIETTGDLTLTVSTTRDAPVGPTGGAVAELNMRFEASASWVSALSSGGQELTITP